MSRHAVASAAFGDLYGWLAAPNPLETRWPRDVPEVLAELRRLALADLQRLRPSRLSRRPIPAELPPSPQERYAARRVLDDSQQREAS